MSLIADFIKIDPGALTIREKQNLNQGSSRIAWYNTKEHTLYVSSKMYYWLAWEVLTVEEFLARIRIYESELRWVADYSTTIFGDISYQLNTDIKSTKELS